METPNLIENHLSISPRVYSAFWTSGDMRRRGYPHHIPARWVFISWRDPDWQPGETPALFNHYELSHN